jgi:hypothetical protein
MTIEMMFFVPIVGFEVVVAVVLVELQATS